MLWSKFWKASPASGIPGGLRVGWCEHLCYFSNTIKLHFSGSALSVNLKYRGRRKPKQQSSWFLCQNWKTFRLSWESVYSQFTSHSKKLGYLVLCEQGKGTQTLSENHKGTPKPCTFEKRLCSEEPPPLAVPEGLLVPSQGGCGWS